MAKIFFGMNQSLDGYVNFDKFGPGPELFRYFIEQTRSLSGSIYGRILYEIMAYWDEEQEGWGDAEREFAVAWRETPKWVVSRTLTSVGPNATLISGDAEAAIRQLKEENEGVFEIGGRQLAHSLQGLVDEYLIYLHPVVLGEGDPFFAGPRPRLHLKASDKMDADVIRLTYTAV